MTRPINELPPLIFDSAARLRSRERWYVALQSLGWGSLLVVQIVFGLILTTGEAREHVIPAGIQLIAIGLLTSHGTRRYMEGAGWKRLGWRALVPRVLKVAAAQGAIITLLLYALQRYLLAWPLPAKLSPITMLVANWMNFSALMVGWLCIYFSYHLFDRFNRLEVERLQLSATVKQAELNALKSQLNPHFIFNSLNSVRALIDEDPKRARESVTQLASLLRYSLQSVQRETVPLEEELRVVTDYLSLEQVRYEERLRLRLEVPVDLLHWPLPPMLLQTLVENAVKYGIAVQPEGGEISITASSTADLLTLRVTNPGRLSEGAVKNPSTGLGLANARARLQLLFGEKSSLLVRALETDLVVAEALIPLQPATRTTR